MPSLRDPSLRTWGLIVGLIAAGLYAPSLGHDFVFDDGIEVVRNRHIRSLDNLPTIFASTAWSGGGLENYLYRPLTTASYAVNHAISGPRPWSYHLFNVVLYATVCVLVLRLASHWGASDRAAIVAALLFAVWPVHVEAVANVSGRKDLLMTLFVLATLLAHGRARETPSRVWGFAAPLLFAAALLAKEAGAAALGMVIAQDWLLGRPETGATRGPRARRGRLLAAHAGVLAAYLLLRWWVVGGLGVRHIPVIDNPAAPADLATRWLTALAVIGYGLRLQVLPMALSPDYSYRAIPLVESPADPRFLLSLGVLVAITAVAIRLRRRSPLVLFSLVFYALALAPVANLLFPIGTIFGERLLFLPSVALCVLAGTLVAPALEAPAPAARRAGLALVAILLLAYAGRAWHYAGQWKDEPTLFAAAARTVPESTKLQHRLAGVLYAEGRSEEAMAAIQRALAIAPHNAMARTSLALMLREAGQLDAAQEEYQRALETEPDNADALHGLALVRRSQGRLDEARELLQRALRVRPDHAPSLGDLGTYHFVEGRLELAEELWRSAARIDPGLATVWFNLGLVYERTGQPERARQAWRRFLDTAGDAHPEQKSIAESRLRGEAGRE